MGETTGISWTDATFNGWIGCTKVSSACDHCYAERDAKRYGLAEWGKGKPRRKTSEANWKKPLQWDRKAAKEGRRMKVFAFSMADVFDEEVSDEWRDEFFELTRRTPNLDWLVLTKRAGKMVGYASRFKRDGNPLPKNIWWGVTVEDQKRAEERIPHLLRMREASGNPDAVLWVSAEPLRGPVDFTKIFLASTQTISADTNALHSLNWIITGGESGPQALPADPAWYRSIRDACNDYGVAFFFKQWGEWMQSIALDIAADGGAEQTIKVHEFPTRNKVWRLGRQHDPQTLDGVEHHESPEGK